jgi:hypothetical protein
MAATPSNADALSRPVAAPLTSKSCNSMKALGVGGRCEAWRTAIKTLKARISTVRLPGIFPFAMRHCCAAGSPLDKPHSLAKAANPAIQINQKEAL